MIAKFDSKARSGTGKELRVYLENGTNHDRDIKDTRVTLFGDIDILQSTIKLGHNKKYKETYRNLIVSFSEDDVPNEDLQQIAQTYIEQYTKGYEEDEIVAYAEAHIPKKKYKSVYNVLTKQYAQIRRKPHINISFALYSPKLDKKLILNSNDKRIYDINLLTRKLELDYGFAPVERKAITKNITQVQATSKKLNDRQDIKNSIDEYIHKNISKIKSYKDLKIQLENNFGIKIIRESTVKAKTKSITILHNNKRIRLKGDIFHDSTFDKAKQQLIDRSNDNENNITERPLNSTDFKIINEELERFNQKKIRYIEEQNRYARDKAKKLIDDSYYRAKKISKNRFITYQAKIYFSIYGKNIAYDLKGFYVKKFEHRPRPITIISNKEKQIKVIDKGEEIIAQGNNLKEEVTLSIQIALSKGWKLEDIITEGSDEFVKESQKQIKQLIIIRDQSTRSLIKRSKVIATQNKTKSFVKELYNPPKINNKKSNEKSNTPDHANDTYKRDQKQPFRRKYN